MGWWRSHRVQALLSVATVALVFGFLLPKLADYGAAWTSITDMRWFEVVLVAAVAVWNLVSYLPLLISVLPGLTVREAAIANFASTAISNTLPGGGALGVGVTVTVQRSFGHSAADVALGAVVSGIWNNFAKLGLPVLALGLVVITGDVPAGLVAAAVAGLGVLVVLIGAFAMLLRSPALARRVGSAAERVAGWPMRLLNRAPRTGWADGAARFRMRTIGLIAGRARRITAATLLNHVSLYLVLLVCLRGRRARARGRLDRGAGCVLGGPPVVGGADHPRWPRRRRARPDRLARPRPAGSRPRTGWPRRSCCTAP